MLANERLHKLSNRQGLPTTKPRHFDLYADIAREHAKNNESARLCLRDAEQVYGRRDVQNAYRRLLHSLAHSVGMFHADYRALKSYIDATFGR
jgi:hypothetical protein